MEKYFLCNFMEENLERESRKGVTNVHISELFSEGINLAKAYISGEGSNLSLNFVGRDEEISGTEFDFIGGFNKDDKRVKLDYKDLAHSDENPMIVVVTRKFEVFENVPTYIKYLPVKGGVIVALVKGVIRVESSDGEMVILARNINKSIENISYPFDADKIKDLNPLVDKESGVKYSDYVVSDCIIFVEPTKDGKHNVNYGFSKDNFSCFYSRVFEEAKEAKQRKLAEAEAARQAKAEENARFKKSMQEKEAAKAQSENVKKASKASKGIKKSITRDTSAPNYQTGFEGAKSFLDFVNGLKNS